MRLYGKVRSSPDYVGSRRDLSRLEGEFDDWLEHAMEFARDAGQEEWQRGYQAGAPHGFLFRALDLGARALTGVMVPSQDSEEHPFPLVLLVPLKEEEMTPGLEYLPVGAERFFLRAGQCVRDCRNSASLAASASILSSIPEPQSRLLETARRDFDTWGAMSGQLPRLWHDLFPAGGAVQVFEAITEVGRIIRARNTDDGRRYLRLPLGTGGGAAVSFWLRILSCAVGDTVCVAAWSFEPHGALLAVVANEPAPVDFWLRLWRPSARDPLLLDATATSWPDVPSTATNAELGRIVRSKTATVGDLIRVLTP